MTQQTAFRYNAARETVEAGKNIAERKHTLEIIRQKAMTHKDNGYPQLVLQFRITDETDPDNGKEVPGWLNFVATELAMKTLDSFMKAIGLDAAQEFGDEVINVPFLSAWAERRLLGEMLVGKTAYTKASAERAPMVVVQEYYPLGSVQSAATLIDLD